MIGRARNRIFISSLYIGSEEGELISALEKALSTHESLHLHLTLDLNRSTRPGPASTTSLLAPLLHAFPERVHVSLFRSPKLKGLMSKLVPPRFNEGWGTWHAKVYGVDNEVMISG
jgi:CDP-diacylglycerol---glycerol-3-phosphate 3-phosphatidyltransferase